MLTPIKLSVPEQTDEQKKANQERLRVWIDEWNKFSEQNPDLARRMMV